MNEEPTPGLKCVIAWSPRRNLCDIVRDRLRAVIAGEETLAVGDDATVVNTAVPAHELRDILREGLPPYEGLLVIDFEVWSGYGQALDAKWLLRRGH